jgi:predicted amidohydrolase YtcJ
MTAWLLRRASTALGVEVDLVVRDGRVAEPARAGEAIEHLVDLEGRPALPGLVDHHVHLMAQAAAWDSVDCSPGALESSGGLAAVLRTARARQPDGWIRGVGYDLATSGSLDRHALDEAGVGPLRVQDRTGMYWMLDSVGLETVLPDVPDQWPPGIVVDGARRPTGTLYRLDDWLRTRLPDQPPDLARVGRWLAQRGVVGVTDATVTNGTEELEVLAAAGLPQKLTAMTESPRTQSVEGVRLGPVKLVLDESRLPSSDELANRIDESHRLGRSVAVHCIDSASVVLAISCGLKPTDRVEHASLVNEDVVGLLARSGVSVTVQPGLVHTRGDRYLEETEPSEAGDLYRLASFLAAGIPVRLSSDAPYGPLDPWITIAAAARRRTTAGRELGAAEAIDEETALDLFSADPQGAPPRTRLEPGSPADLIVLDSGWDSMTEGPSVALTLIDGVPVHSRIGELAVPQDHT